MQRKAPALSNLPCRIVTMPLAASKSPRPIASLIRMPVAAKRLIKV
ncbi:hypothetical protein [Pseudorhodobacter ferrugineus]|nr:hypothetical protein [Pseudorhodobacter ferrugineus]